MKRLALVVLLALACLACRNPAAPHTNCIYTDTIIFTFQGETYGQPEWWYAHGAACDSLMREWPTRTRWI